jgi:hypothetical protein
MGGIDLDPASRAVANQRVKASEFYTIDDDGLSAMWYGKVWLNHPFSRRGNHLWVQKLLTERLVGHVQQACCITYACTSEAWFRPLLEYPMCFLFPRTNYLLPDGSVKRGVTKGSVVTYLGPNELAFRREFQHLGKVKL